MSDVFPPAEDETSRADSEFTKCISTIHLKKGMYVQELDRPWVETPFLFQGFELKDEADIKILSELCVYVYINVDRGVDCQQVYRPADSGKKPDKTELLRITHLPLTKTQYQDAAAVEDELVRARESHEKTTSLVRDLFDDLRNKGKLDIPRVKEAVIEITDSVLRNPDAFMLLRRLKAKDTYSYSHAIDSCALAASFCRHLGFPREELNEIAMGSLLLDIGKLRIPEEILEKNERLTEEEFKLMQTHPDLGMKIIKEAGQASQTVLAMVNSHHERIDGKGYPNKFEGESIPICGRIAAIIDCYDAMTSDRPYKKAISTHEAIRELYKWRNTDFQEDLVEQFIQCQGIYPTGTLVELTTGQVGVVMSQNRIRRLSPKLLLIMDAEKEVYEDPFIFDLMMHDVNTRGERMTISHALEPEELNINPGDFYL